MIYSGTITDSASTEDGTTFYSVTSPSGFTYTPCFKTGLAGLPQAFSTAPYGVGSEVIIVSVDDNVDGPFFIISGIVAVEDQTAMAATEAAFVAGAEYTTFTEQDMALRNGNCAVNLVGNGDSVAVTGVSLNMQLRGGNFSVFSQGVASNQVLNARDTIDTLTQYFEQVNMKLQLLESAITAAGPGVTAAYSAAAAAATAAGNPVLAEQLQAQGTELNAALASLASGIPVSPSDTVKADLLTGVNSKIRIP